MWERNKKEIVLGMSAVLALGAGTLWVATGSNGSQADAATGPVARRIERPKNPDRGIERIKRPRRPLANKDDGGGKTVRPVRDHKRGGKSHRRPHRPGVTKKHKQPKPAA